MRLKLQLFPNREIRASINPEPRLNRKPDSTYEPIAESHDESQDEQGKIDKRHATDDRSNLDISSDFTERLKPGYGGLPRKTVFGLNGKRTIQRVGGVFDRLFKPSECVFLTGTLPGSTPESLETMARYSGLIVKMLKDWIKYYVKSEYSFHCWEWQGRGALHLHYCVAIDAHGNRELVVERFKSEWLRILDAVSAASGIDMYARRGFGTWRSNKAVVQAYAQTVRTSVAAYLSKYCSKGHDTSKAFNCPSRWWGCSRAALHSLREMTLTIAVDSLSTRKALALFQDVMSVTDALTIKSYSFPHGSGFGCSHVGYHDGTSSDEGIWKTLEATFVSYSMTYSAQRGMKSQSRGEMQGILQLLLSRNSQSVSLSVPLREKLEMMSSDSLMERQLTLADWREIYSIICCRLSATSYTQSHLKLKRFALSRVRTLSTDEQYKK